MDGIFIELSLIGDNFNNNGEFSLSDFITFFFGVIFLYKLSKDGFNNKSLITKQFLFLLIYLLKLIFFD